MKPIQLPLPAPLHSAFRFGTTLRRARQRMPAIMVTGANAEQDVVHGLEARANDYLAKPYRLPELLALVRAQLRVFDNLGDATILIGLYVFRPSVRLQQETARIRKVPLTNKDCIILKYLCRAGGKCVSQQT